MTDTHVMLRGSVAQIKSMLRESALEGDTAHDDVFLQVTEDEVRVLAAAPGEVVLTYCSFDHDWFDHVDLIRDAHSIEFEDRQGEANEREVYAEAILDVEDTIGYLDLATDGGTVELEFAGSTDRRLASNVRFNGAIETGVRLPGSEDAVQSVPMWMPGRWTDENRYTDSSGEKTMPVTIETKVDVVQRIVDAVQMDRDAEFYPIAVEDGEFRMEVGEEDRGYARGSLQASTVEGPNVENYYFDGFGEIFSALSGAVTLQTAPADGGAPLAVVQTSDHGKTLRHVNGPVNE